MRVVFLGTPLIALEVLKSLDASFYDVVAVVTQPDRANARGNKVIFSPVKNYAMERGIPVYQFNSISKEGEDDLKSLSPDVMVTCAYGQILRQNILSICPIFNVHASLLPKYRGSSPVQWALIAGEKEVGVTIMKTDIGVDTGDIVLEESITLSGDENCDEVLDKLAVLGGKLIVDALGLYENGDIRYIPQNEADATHCRMLEKSDGEIDFHKSAEEIKNLIRGVTPWPGAFTTSALGKLKILKANVKVGDFGGNATGEVVVSDHKNGLIVKCGQDYLDLLTVQGENAKAMDAKAYLLGHKIPVGSVFGA